MPLKPLDSRLTPDPCSKKIQGRLRFRVAVAKSALMKRRLAIGVGQFDGTRPIQSL